MATAISSARAEVPTRGTRQSDEIKLDTNRPQTFALKYATGRPVGNWGNVMFTAVDSRRLFLNAEDAGEFEHSLRDLNVQPAEFIKVTRVKHGTARGGGFSIRVERVEDEPSQSVSNRIDPSQGVSASRTEALLEKSIGMVRQRAAVGEKSAPAARVQVADPEMVKTGSAGRRDDRSPNGTAPVVITPASAKMCAAMCSAVDAVIETQAYATRRGLGLTFSEESVRAIGLSIYIGASREGGR